MNLLIKPFLILSTICLVLFLVYQATNQDDGLVNNFISNEEEGGDGEDEGSHVIIVDGFKALQLEEEVVSNSGIISKSAEKIFFTPEMMAYAEIIDIAPLVSLKTEFEATLAEQNILINDLHNYNKILKRAEALYEAKSLSARDLDKNRADRDLKSSELSAVNTRLASIKYKVKSAWGDVLAGFLFDKNKRSEFDLLASNTVKLVLLSLPKNKTFNPQGRNVFISHVNEREAAIKASYLDYSNYVNNPMYGESYFYLLESEKIRMGMKLFAWIDENSEKIEGLFIPDSAVIWYANEPWVYTKRRGDLFLRKPLGEAARKINKGWLLEDSKLINDETVIVRGGQTLLSEEFKWAIPDEDDD